VNPAPAPATGPAPWPLVASGAAPHCDLAARQVQVFEPVDSAFAREESTAWEVRTERIVFAVAAVPPRRRSGRQLRPGSGGCQGRRLRRLDRARKHQRQSVEAGLDAARSAPEAESGADRIAGSSRLGGNQTLCAMVRRRGNLRPGFSIDMPRDSCAMVLSRRGTSEGRFEWPRATAHLCRRLSAICRQDPRRDTRARQDSNL
jgi:hypothetical protein